MQKLILALTALTFLSGPAMAKFGDQFGGTIKTGPYQTCGKGKCVGDGYDPLKKGH